jgi:catalase
VAQVHNHQRDGMHRQAVVRGRVAYEPNSLGGGCPFQAGRAGFTSFPERVEDSKVRGKPEKFAEHYHQATLFWNSQAPHEKSHIIAAFRFELSKVQFAAIRERMVSSLRNVSDELARAVAEGLGMALPDPMPRALPRPPRPEVERSAALSLTARPGSLGAQTRRVAIIVADGVDGAMATALHEALEARGAVPRFVAARLGSVKSATSGPLPVEISIEAAPSVLWDAVVVADGDWAPGAPPDGQTKAMIEMAYRHCKPLLFIGGGNALAEAAHLPEALPNGTPDHGLMRCDSAELDVAIEDLVRAMAQHRIYERETDPPRV